jgi:hypothetical protein
VFCLLWRGSILFLRLFACFKAFASAFSLALVPGTTFGVPTAVWDGAIDPSVGLGEINGALGEGVGLGEINGALGEGVGLGEINGALGEGVGAGEINGALGEGVGLGEVVSVRGRAKASSAPNPKSRKPDIRTTPKRLTRHRLPTTTVAPPRRDSLLIRFIYPKSAVARKPFWHRGKIVTAIERVCPWKIAREDLHERRVLVPMGRNSRPQVL